MKTSTKIILAATSLGILSLGVDLQAVYAINAQAQMKIMAQTHSTKQVAEPSDGDKEENDATEAPDLVKQPHRTNSSTSRKIQEANNIGSHNDTKKAFEQVKHNQTHAAANSDNNKQDDSGYDAPNDADSSHEDAH